MFLKRVLFYECEYCGHKGANGTYICNYCKTPIDIEKAKKYTHKLELEMYRKLDMVI